MITQSGVHIQKIGGADGTPTSLDIALQSSRVTRFGGAVWSPLLPHLIFVGLMAYRRSGVLENLLWGFLHDAHEIVTGEIPRPFKCDCMRAEQNAIDERLKAQYFTNAMLARIDHPLIKQCDVDACDLEAIHLGLLKYEEIETSYETDQAIHRKTLYSDSDDMALLAHINRVPAIAAITFFTAVLEAAREGVYHNILPMVRDRGWL